MEALIKLGLLLVLAVIGYFYGRRNALREWQLLRESEEKFREVLVFASRYSPSESAICDPVLVSGSAVVAADHFQYLIATLRKLLGGSYTAYEQLNQLARRLAIVRMKEEAKKYNANMVFNMRINATRISHPREGGTPQIEVHVYGTAFVPAQGTVAESRVHVLPIDFPPPVPVPSVFDNRVIVGIFLGFIGLSFFCLFEAVIDRSLQHQWRYVNGAPWFLFGGVASIGCLAAGIYARYKQARLSEAVVMPALLALPLAISFYFLCIHFATLTQTPQIVEYMVARNGNLQPRIPSQYPTVDTGEFRDYWIAQPPEPVASLEMLRILPGVYLVDMAPLATQYKSFSK